MLSLISDRSDEQRARSVVVFLSSLLGSGHDSALATLRCRSASTNGYALATELSLASKTMDNIHNAYDSIFPRVSVAVLPSPDDINLTTYNGFGSGLSSPNLTVVGKTSKKLVRTFRGGNPSPVEVQRSTLKKKKRLYQSKLSGALYDVSRGRYIVNQSTKTEASNISNRGHRMLMQQLTLTDMAFGEAAEVSRLVQQSKVLQGKNWRSWNWSVVEDIISGPLRIPVAFAEISKSKFLKRLLGFFRVTHAGQFIALPWLPDNVPFASIGLSLLSVMLRCKSGVAMLKNDRRGKIHAQLVQALKVELDHAEKVAYEYSSESHMQGSLSNRHENFSGSDSLDPERILTQSGCSNTMAREVFALLGVYTSYKPGIHLISKAGMFEVLTEISFWPQKRYITRLVVTHLDYSSSVECREWLTSLMANESIYTEIKVFSLGFLRAFAHTSYAEGDGSIVAWILECFMTAYSLHDDEVEELALSLVYEMCFYPNYLRMLVITYGLGPFVNEVQEKKYPIMRMILLKYLENPEGLAMLHAEGWIATAMDTKSGWALPALESQTFKKEESLSSHFLESGKYISLYDASENGQLASRGSQPFRNTGSNQFIMFKPTPISLYSSDAFIGSFQSLQMPDFMAVYRVPWTIEIWLVLPGGKKIQIPATTHLETVPKR